MRRLAVLAAALALVALPMAHVSAGGIPQNIDVSQRSGNEAEEAIAINPTNPDNIVVLTNIGEGRTGLFKAVSFDGGLTWTREIIADSDNNPLDPLGDGCCDPSLAFDEYGNLFVSYMYNVEAAVPVALSTDGGLTMNLIATIAKPTKTTGTGERQGTFRWVDQETIVAGQGMTWIVFNAGGPMVAAGAAVTGLGQVGAFQPAELIPGTNNCTYGDVAIGPSGQVMNVCTLTESGQGGGKLFVNVDPDGLGPAGFGSRVYVSPTHVGGYDFVPPQPDRSIDAEPGLAWDRSGGPNTGRAYLVYTTEVKNESDNTDVMVRYSDDDGATWSAATRVNDDATTNTQLLPKIALDQTTGTVAVSWHDARNDDGNGGPDDTDGIPNTDAQLWGSFSSDGVSFDPNFRISAGTSNAHVSGNGTDYGDYSGLAFYGGIARPAWADNSNSTGDNPDGYLTKLDVYSAAIRP